MVRSVTDDILLAPSAAAWWSLRGMLTVRGTVRGNVGTAAADAGPPPDWYASAPALPPHATGRFLPARRYASAGTRYGPVSVCLSVTSRCSIKRTHTHIHTRLTALCPGLHG